MSNYSKHSEYVFDIKELKELFNANPSHTKVYISIGFEQVSSGTKIFKAKVLAETGLIGGPEPSIEGQKPTNGCPNPPGC